jgi:YgiT-type zinc finger domain-containing protein
MKCIICHSTDISLRRVNEQLSRGQDMILVPVDVLVCNNCGERYYDRRTMQKLEEIEVGKQTFVPFMAFRSFRDPDPRVSNTAGLDDYGLGSFWNSEEEGLL